MRLRTPTASRFGRRKSDRNVAIRLRVRLGGEQMTAVATDYGYRDGSGIHGVIQRLQKKPRAIKHWHGA